MTIAPFQHFMDAVQRQQQRNDKLTARLFDAETDEQIGWNIFDSHLSIWPWAQRHLAFIHDCEVDEVDCIETDDGDRITVRGKIVAYFNGK